MDIALRARTAVYSIALLHSFGANRCSRNGIYNLVGNLAKKPLRITDNI